MNLKPAMSFQSIATILSWQVRTFPIPTLLKPSILPYVAKRTPPTLLRFRCRSAKDWAWERGMALRQLWLQTFSCFQEGFFPTQWASYYLTKESSLTSVGVGRGGYVFLTAMLFLWESCQEYLVVNKGETDPGSEPPYRMKGPDTLDVPQAHGRPKAKERLQTEADCELRRLN